MFQYIKIKVHDFYILIFEVSKEIFIIGVSIVFAYSHGSSLLSSLWNPPFLFFMLMYVHVKVIFKGNKS